jgi:N-acetylmuramoyl-L-alanine amidase
MEVDQPPSVPMKDPGIQQQEKLSKYSHVENIRFHSGPEFTRVVVDLSGQIKYKVGRLEDPDRIYVDLEAVVITAPKRTIPIDDKVIKRIRAAQFNENTVRMALDIKQIQRYNVFYLKEPDRLVVDVYGSDSSDAPPSRPSPPDQPQAIPLVKQLGLKVKTIVIDPGHGGKDPGTVSKSGLQEKRVVLDIAKRLKKLLESSGYYHVYLTRETDIFIPLEERTAFANQKGADVFISLHINSHKNRNAQGIETYYLSLASDEEARLTAALENASAGKTIKDLSSLLRYILRGTKVKESRELARTVQSRLCQRSGANDRGIRRAPFIVLIGAKAPSVLVELGFMSNRQDERLLRSGDHKGKLARALMEAVKNYIKTIDQAS